MATAMGSAEKVVTGERSTGEADAGEVGASGSRSAEASIREVADLAARLCTRMTNATDSIARITDQTRMLSFNARIEAARAGGRAGAAFSVVASEMTQFAEGTAQVARQMHLESNGLIEQLLRVNTHLETDFFGSYLAAAALTQMDLIDRNLYERSCDCRWWATDAAAVDLLTDPSEATRAHACKRLGVILDSYTVYLDIVLADLSGRVVACGRPEKYPAIGQDVSGAAWFRGALATRSGGEFAFESAHKSRLVGEQAALVYSAAVREGGETNGKAVGVLGVLFDWAPFASRILASAPISAEQRDHTRLVVVDDTGRLLADSAGRAIGERFFFAEFESMLAESKNYRVCTVGGDRTLVAHGRSPGFETYATGWHAFILQKVMARQDRAAAA